ncbi:MAG: hypothetical protein QM727_07825 [Niabella sp.]
MKKGLLWMILLGLASFVYGQSVYDSVRIQGFIPVCHTDAQNWVQRYQEDIDHYNAENKSLKDRTCDVLFLGSSSINLWNNIYNDLAPLKIIRRSYGGSTIRDNIYNYNTIARGYKPKKIAIYIENDLGNGKESVSPGETYDLFRLFVQMLQRDYPQVPIYIISFKPSFAKQDQLPDQLVVNKLLEDFAKRIPFVEYIDITKTMYDDKGKLREDIFRQDKLHMNQKGYDLWIKVLKPILLSGL